MNELLENNQIINVVTQDLKNSNKGRIVELKERTFLLELFHAPEGVYQSSIHRCWIDSINMLGFYVFMLCSFFELSGSLVLKVVFTRALSIVVG